MHISWNKGGKIRKRGKRVHVKIMSKWQNLARHSQLIEIDIVNQSQSNSQKKITNFSPLAKINNN